jgi:hypothetical protein
MDFPTGSWCRANATAPIAFAAANGVVIFGFGIFNKLQGSFASVLLMESWLFIPAALSRCCCRRKKSKFLADWQLTGFPSGCLSRKKKFRNLPTMRSPLPHLSLAAILAFAYLGSGALAVETLNLLELIRQEDQSKPVERTRLSPEWVGTIRGDNEEDLHLRLTHAGRDTKQEGKETVGHIWAARMRENGSYTGSDYAEFRVKLPSAVELKVAKELPQLIALLGKQQGASIDGWDDGERRHWNQSWSCFTATGKDTLRWVAVTASISSKSQDKSPTPEQTRIDELKIREGALRPATPGLAPEEDLFKTADQLHEMAERAKEAERTRIPQPLRDLVAADEEPDDPDLKIFAAAISKVRRNPEAEIFRQMAAFDDSGSGLSYLEYVLLDRIPGVEKWTPENRSKALHLVVDALAAAPDGDKLQTMSATLLEAMGGGKLEIAEPKMDLEVKLRKSSKSMSYSQWNVDEGNLPQASKAVAEWFRGRLK